MRCVLVGGDVGQILPLIQPLSHLLLQVETPREVKGEGERHPLLVPAGLHGVPLHSGDGEVLPVQDELEVECAADAGGGGDDLEVVGIVGEEGAGVIAGEAEVPAEAVNEAEGQATAGNEHEEAEEAVGGVRADGLESAPLVVVQAEERRGGADDGAGGSAGGGRGQLLDEGGGEEADEADGAEGEAEVSSVGGDEGEGERRTGRGGRGSGGREEEEVLEGMERLEVLLLLDGVVESAVADPLHPGVDEGAPRLGDGWPAVKATQEAAEGRRLRHRWRRNGSTPPWFRPDGRKPVADDATGPGFRRVFS